MNNMMMMMMKNSLCWWQEQADELQQIRNIYITLKKMNNGFIPN